MEKKDILNKIRNVKSEHSRWITYAEAKIKGLAISDDLVPVKHTECGCGKMFNNTGQIRFHLESAKSIPVDHEEFHKIYEILYDLMNNKVEGNFLTKGSNKRKKEKQINDYLDILKRLSENIKHSFDNVMQEVEDLPDATFKNMFG